MAKSQSALCGDAGVIIIAIISSISALAVVHDN